MKISKVFIYSVMIGYSGAGQLIFTNKPTDNEIIEALTLQLKNSKLFTEDIKIEDNNGIISVNGIKVDIIKGENTLFKNSELDTCKFNY